MEVVRLSPMLCLKATFILIQKLKQIWTEQTEPQLLQGSLGANKLEMFYQKLQEL